MYGALLGHWSVYHPWLCRVSGEPRTKHISSLAAKLLFADRVTWHSLWILKIIPRWPNAWRSMRQCLPSFRSMGKCRTCCLMVTLVRGSTTVIKPWPKQLVVKGFIWLLLSYHCSSSRELKQSRTPEAGIDAEGMEGCCLQPLSYSLLLTKTELS